MRLPYSIILAASVLYLSVPNAMAGDTILGSVPSDRFSGQINNQNKNGFSTIFAVGAEISGSMKMDVDPDDVGKEMPLYLVAKRDEDWFVRTEAGDWRRWNRQLNDLVPYTSRMLEAQEKLDLPLEDAQLEGEYSLFSGYLNREKNVVFNQKPLNFSLLDETKPRLHPVTSAPMLEQILKDGLKTQSNFITHLDFAAEGTGDAISFTADSSTTANAQTRNFSTTNIQESGVEEADRIKTNGTNLFVLGDCSTQQKPETANGLPIAIVTDTCIFSHQLATDTAEATKIGETTINSEHYFNKLYLANSQTDGQSDLLVAVGKSNGGYNIAASTFWYDPWGWQAQSTEIQWFNADNTASLIKTHQLKIDGSLISSRRIDRILYIVTRYTPAIQNYTQYPITDEDRVKNEEILAETTLVDLLPKISYDKEAFDQLVAAENCFIPPVAKDVTPDPSIITITAIQLDNPSQTDSTCIVGGSETLYMSPDSLYLATTRYEYQRATVDRAIGVTDGVIFNPDHKTDIHKFSISGSKVTYKGSGDVTGHLGWHEDKKAYRMSEHNGILRVATSIGDNWQDTSSTTLWTLKEAENTAQLEVIGELADLGKPGEQLYASRFIGDRGYLVTFRLTDPLYIVDLSEPTSPNILGELEIDGYSDYLHPVGENYILGIGKDAIADTQSTDNRGRGAWYQGVKLSLFDVSDPSQPSEVNSIVLGKRGTESDVLYDFHALAYLPPNDVRGARLAIPVTLNEHVLPDRIELDITEPAETTNTTTHPSTWYGPTHKGLYLFDINVIGEIGIKQRGKIISQQAKIDQNQWPFFEQRTNFGRTDRAVLKGDNVFYIHGTDVTPKNWSELSTD